MKTGTTLPPHGILIDSRRKRLDSENPIHSHNHPSLLYIASGEGACMCGETLLELKSDTALLLDAGVEHRLHEAVGKPMLVFVIYFTQQLAEEMAGTIGSLLQSPSCMSVTGHRGVEVKRLIRRMLHEQASTPAHFEITLRWLLEGILLELRREYEWRQQLGRVKYSSIERVRHVLLYVNERYFEPHDLDTVAKMARLSTRQFTTHCRTLTGDSFAHYINRLRIERAQQRLTQSELPIAAIAFEVGFEDLSTFYRVFKRICSVTPVQFRRQQS